MRSENSLIFNWLINTGVHFFTFTERHYQLWQSDHVTTSCSKSSVHVILWNWIKLLWNCSWTSLNISIYSSHNSNSVLEIQRLFTETHVWSLRKSNGVQIHRTLFQPIRTWHWLCAMGSSKIFHRGWPGGGSMKFFGWQARNHFISEHGQKKGPHLSK